MSPREWRFRIEDILNGIQAVQEYTGGMDFDQFATDSKTIDAVLHRLEIIGEAAAHVPNEVAERAPTVDWIRMRAMRNVIVHEYFGVSLPIIWNTICKELPSLESSLRNLLDQPDSESE